MPSRRAGGCDPVDAADRRRDLRSLRLMQGVPTMTEPALTLTGITKTYPGVRALDDVSVSVARGKVHAVLGENGAGKSTLVGIAAGSVVPDAGTIGLAGEEFTRIQ